MSPPKLLHSSSYCALLNTPTFYMAVNLLLVEKPLLNFVVSLLKLTQSGAIIYGCFISLLCMLNNRCHQFE